MEEDAGMMLNMFQGDAKTERNERILGNRGQRIKQRRGIKRAALSSADKNRSASKEDGSSSEDDLPAVKIHKKGSGSAENSEQRYKRNVKGVISSLFNRNPDIPDMPQSKVKQVREEIFGDDSFRNIGIHQHLVSCVEEKMGFKTMTAVQTKGLPPILEGKDVLVRSQTGSGKTLTYALPLVHQLKCIEPRLKRSDGVRALIILPTRELVLQTAAVFTQLLQTCVWVVAGTLMGGQSRKAEKACLRKGVSILIGTPGRLLDHVKRTASLTLDQVQTVVIDEADRLFDLGFERDVRVLLDALYGTSQDGETEQKEVEGKRKPQTVLLSATLTSGVELLAGLTLQSPVRIDNSGIDSSNAPTSSELTATVPQRDTKLVLPAKLKQYFAVIPSKLRLVTLASFLLGQFEMAKQKMIVFVPTQDVVEFLKEAFGSVLELQDGGFKLYCLHGSMEQQDRSEVFRTFLAAKSGVLLCTDVAARGLDLHGVSWIVQYCAPPSVEDYVHRVGRTARIGEKGSSLLFLLPSESAYTTLLADSGINVQKMNMEKILANSSLRASRLPTKSGKVPHTMEQCATALQQAFEEFVYSGLESKTLALKAYRSFVRSYATYPADTKHIFHIKGLHLGHVAKTFGLREAPSKMITHDHEAKGKKKGRKRVRHVKT